MNILVISENFTIGGLETHIYTQYIALRDQNTFVFVFGNYKNDYDFGDSKVYSGFNFNPNVTIGQFYDDAKRLIEIIKENNIDLIHIHPFFSFFPAVIASQITNKPIVYTYHGYSSYNFPTSNNQLLLFNYFLESGISKFFSVTKTGIDCLKNYNKLNNVIHLPNPIDTKLYKTHRIINNKKWALISRIDEDKISEILLLLKRLNNLDIEKIDIFGDGNCRLIVEKYINDNKLEAKVKLKGYCHDVPKTINGKYNGIIGIGRVIMEGIAMKYPTLIIGYNKIGGIVTLEMYNNIKDLNFVNKTLPNISDEDLNKQLLNVYSNQGYYDLRNILETEFSSTIIMKKYEQEIKNIRFNYVLGVENFYNGLKKLTINDDFSNEYFFDSKLIYNLCKNNLEAWVLTANIKSLFTIYDKYYAILDKQNNLESMQNNLNNKQNNLKNMIDELNNKVSSIEEQINDIGKQFSGGKIMSFIKRVFNKLRRIFNSIYKINTKRIITPLLKSIKLDNYTTIIVFENNFGWEGIMKQRPQQIASHFDNKVLFFYHSDRNEYDNKLNYKKIKDNLYLLNLNLYRKVLLKYLEKKNNKFVMIYSTDYVSTKIINDYISNNFKVIYEYVDDIDEKLSGIKGATKLRKNYDFIINRDDSYIICTATKLYNNVLRDNPNAKVRLITNGCDYEHFKKKSYDMPLKIKKVKSSSKPIIGYYGALASWFDYELIKKIAALNRYEIILIGIKYDNSFNNSKINKLSNVHYLEKMDYKALPKYSSFFDVCIIPFVINKITLSTSPVKVFEYMASEKPIVTTDLPECRKYKSVLISKNHTEFISNLDKAIKLVNNKDYINSLRKEALNNTWESKCNEMIYFIKEV